MALSTEKKVQQKNWKNKKKVHCIATDHLIIINITICSINSINKNNNNTIWQKKKYKEQ